MNTLTFAESPNLRLYRTTVLAGLLLVAWLTFACELAWAQSEKPRPAVIAFQAEPSRILDSNFAKAIRLQDSRRFDPVSAQLWRAKSVKGLVALPDDVQAFTDMRPGEATPFHYYFEFEMSSEQHVRDLKDALRQRMSDPEERDGIAYFYPSYEADAYVAVTNKRRVIMSSGSYEYDPGRFPGMTETADRLLKETQKATAGLAVDVKGAERLVRSAVEFGEENMPPPGQGFLSIPEKLMWIRGDFVLIPNPEIRMMIECTDRNAAEEVEEAIRGVIGLGKMSLRGQGLEADIQLKFLETIKSQVDGRRVLVTALLPTDLLAKVAERSDEAVAMNNVRQATIAIHNYESVNGRLPFQPGPGQSDDLSWRVRVLPFLEQDVLFRQFDLSQAWDSAANRQLSETVIPVFGETNQTGLRWVQSDVQRFADLTDGTANTIAFIHNAPPVPWAANQPLTHNDAVRMFLALKPGESMIVGMYDGSVQRITADMKIETFEAMLTPNGGEVIEYDR